MLLIKILKHLGKIMRIKLYTSIKFDTSFAYETQFLDKLQNCDYIFFRGFFKKKDFDLG